MELETITLSEISLTLEDKCYMVLYIWNHNERDEGRWGARREQDHNLQEVVRGIRKVI
jgi:hypothetical protein